MNTARATRLQRPEVDKTIFVLRSRLDCPSVVQVLIPVLMVRVLHHWTVPSHLQVNDILTPTTLSMATRASAPPLVSSCPLVVVQLFEGEVLVAHQAIEVSRSLSLVVPWDPSRPWDVTGTRILMGDHGVNIIESIDRNMAAP